MELDHVALPSQDIAASVRWYVEMFGARAVRGCDLGVFEGGAGEDRPGDADQHPPHVAVRVDAAMLAEAAREVGKLIDRHRDGTQGIYVSDPDGNQVELICYPAGETVYK